MIPNDWPKIPRIWIAGYPTYSVSDLYFRCTSVGLAELYFGVHQWPIHFRLVVTRFRQLALCCDGKPIFDGATEFNENKDLIHKVNTLRSPLVIVGQSHLCPEHFGAFLCHGGTRGDHDAQSFVVLSFP
jgi:hypothetical protein